MYFVPSLSSVGGVEEANVAENTSRGFVDFGNCLLSLSLCHDTLSSAGFFQQVLRLKGAPHVPRCVKVWGYCRESRRVYVRLEHDSHVRPVYPFGCCPPCVSPGGGLLSARYPRVHPLSLASYFLITSSLCYVVDFCTSINAAMLHGVTMFCYRSTIIRTERSTAPHDPDM